MCWILWLEVRTRGANDNTNLQKAQASGEKSTGVTTSYFPGLWSSLHDAISLAYCSVEQWYYISKQYSTSLDMLTLCR